MLGDTDLPYLLSADWGVPVTYRGATTSAILDTAQSEEQDRLGGRYLRDSLVLHINAADLKADGVLYGLKVEETLTVDGTVYNVRLIQQTQDPRMVDILLSE